MSRNFEVLQRLERERSAPSGASVAVAMVQEPSVAALPFVEPRPRQNAGPLTTAERLAREEEIKLIQQLFLQPGSVRNRVVVFAGAEPAVGCSETCLRAAEVLALRVAGKVCLVQASSDLIAGQASWREAARRIAPNLWMLTASRQATKPRLGSSSAIAQQLLRLREQFDYVLIDSPAVQHHGETSLLVQGADSEVLVIKAGQTRREAVQRALAILRAGNAQIAGMVLNQRTFPVPQALYERL